MYQYPTVDNFNHTTVISVFNGASSDLTNALQPLLYDLSHVQITYLVSQVLTFSIIWKTLVILLLLSNIKGLPLIWHLRIINAFRFCLRSHRSMVPLTPASIFQPLITASHGPLMEVDFVNCHKGNSSYFSDVDVARTHLLCTLFSLGIESLRGGTTALSAFKSASKGKEEGTGVFGIALGGIQASFRKELKPYEGYEMWTKIVSWDEKWIYIVTHFVELGASKHASRSTLYPQQDSSKKRWGSRDSSRRNNAISGDSDSEISATVEQAVQPPKIYATALSKCVCKLGRKTVKPEVMLRLSKLLPSLESSKDLLPCKLGPMLEAGWSMDRVEGERMKGLEIVGKMLSGAAQEGLENEFNGCGEILGKHTDGSGIVGVVTTLASLGGLWKGQIL